MKIKIVLTATREVEIKPEWYPTGIPKTSIICDQFTMSAREDPSLFLDDYNTKIDITTTAIE